MENQRWADERIPVLLDTPAAVRFLSCEPLLSGLNLRLGDTQRCFCGEIRLNCDCPNLDLVIAGGESGPGRAERKLVERCSNYSHEGPEKSWTAGPHRRGCTGWRPKPQALEWLRKLRDDCQAAGVPFFFKQWGGPRPGSGGRLLDGRTWNQLPEVR